MSHHCKLVSVFFPFLRSYIPCVPVYPRCMKVFEESLPQAKFQPMSVTVGSFVFHPNARLDMEWSASVVNSSIVVAFKNVWSDGKPSICTPGKRRVCIKAERSWAVENKPAWPEIPPSEKLYLNP